MALVSFLFTGLYPRKLRHRLISITLTLLCITTYLLLNQYQIKHISSTDRITTLSASGNAHDSVRGMQHTKFYDTEQQITLSPIQELAAISSFLASLPQNTIPLSIDPSVTIDPQLVLDFNTHSDHALKEIKYMVDDVWWRNPVFLYSKFYSPTSREIKAILAKMHLRPAPTIIDIDTRDDAKVLELLIFRLTASSDLPVLLVGGKPMGSIEDIRALDRSGTLRKLITASGAVIGGSRRKQHRT